MSERNASGSPVFYDPRGRRWKHLRRTYLALGVAVTVVAAIFITSVLSSPFLPHYDLRPLKHLPRATDLKPQPRTQIPNAREAKAKKAQAELQKLSHKRA